MIRIGVLMSGVFRVVGWGCGVVGGTRSSVHVPGLFSVITTLATVTPEKYKQKYIRGCQLKMGSDYYTEETGYMLDVLCRQPIKLFQVVSTSEFHEYQ